MGAVLELNGDLVTGRPLWSLLWIGGGRLLGALADLRPV